MKTLAWAGGFLCSLYAYQILMHLFNMDGTAGLADISGKEITKVHVESGRVGSDIITHVSAREGMYHFAMIIMLLNICWSGYAKQKLIAMGIYLTYQLSKLVLKFAVPWDGQTPTDTFDFGMPIQAIRHIVFNPCFILGCGAYLDDDIWEFFGNEPVDYGKQD
jgi:hypothetical protein